MAKKTDAVTRWWRRVSLRAKVTGVTVGVLAVGLLVAGFGTAIFLRTTLITNVNTQVQQLAATDVASGLFTVDNSGGTVAFSVRSDVPSPPYFVAIYGPDGSKVISAGTRDAPEPVFPDEVSLLYVQTQGLEPITLEGAQGGPGFQASVAPYPIPGVNDLYTQLVALPLASTTQVVAQYIGIYSILAVIILAVGAFLTRYVVTLTFRSLGQVETTAMAIAGGDLAQRMTDIEPTTEVGRLKLAINTMLDRVDAAISQRDATVRQMRRFIGDASHELRTPLVSVRGYAELYRMGAIRGEEDTAQAMERIEKEAIRMGALVEDLLALTRLDERRDVVIVPVDLRPVARDAALDLRAASPQRTVTVIDTTVRAEPAAHEAALEHAAEESASQRRRAGTPTSAIARAGVTTLSLLRRKPRPVPASQATTAADAGAHSPEVAPIELDLPSTTPPAPVAAPVVLGEEDRIRQVVANLVANARRYTPEDSPIELTIGVDPRAAMGWIAVVDHGEGVPDQIKEQIFQRFWRADTSRARETGGSGLGLSIVASVVETLHGSVTVEDTPGGGATFRVAFPLAAERDAAEHLLIETQPLPRLASDRG